MKYIKNIPAMALVSFVYWLAFAQNVTFFVWVSWIFLGLFFIGLFLKDTHKEFEKYGIFNFLLGLPFAVFNYYILWTFDETKVYLVSYIIISLLSYSVLFHVKSKNEN